MLQIRNLMYEIGERTLLDEVNWNIHPGMRYALVGPNGAGKTTFFKLITGLLEPMQGEMIRSKGYVIGYLPQEEAAAEQGTIVDVVLQGHDEMLALEKEIHRLHHELEADPEASERLLKKLGALEQRYDQLGGYHLETEAKAILSGLGFSDGDFHRSLDEFSGGWRMRVYLARLLTQHPDLLLLDEPTNHLDLPALEWLEQYLLKFKGSIILISHDRFFIDRLANEIFELEMGQITRYKGNYHFYEEEKTRRHQQLVEKKKALDEERERHQRFIDRFRYKATKAAAVQSRIKMLEKMETVELPPARKSIHFTLQADSPSYKDVLHMKKMSFRYDADWVLRDINFSLYRGERVALVGVNGAGKTTLTRLICGELAPQEGEVTVGQRVSIGYYAQHQVDALDLNATVMDEVSASASRVLSPKVRDFLGVFGFSGDDVYKNVGVLSGGEKARVSLAKMLTSPANFLVMDEPTNHLDRFSREALEDALKSYDGTLLLISHDRYFLDRLVSRVVEVEDHTLRVYEGNYSDYLKKRLGRGDEKPAGAVSEENSQKKRGNEARRQARKQCNRLIKEAEVLESSIMEMEASRDELEKRLGQPETYQDNRLFQQLNREYETVKSDLKSAYARWENMQLEIEELEADLD